MINVTAAIIERDGNIFLAKRPSTSSLPNKWEFPGGKVEFGESPEECLERELLEEFEIFATIGEFFGESIYHYERKTVRLIAFRVHYEDDIKKMKAHDDIRWVPIEQLLEYDLAAADVAIARDVQKCNW
jgi:8-oxo-dGTP diphosphatase